MNWQTRRVRDMAQLINGHPFDSQDFTAESGIPLVRIRDLLGDSFETYVPDDVVPAQAKVGNGDVLIGMDGDFNVALWDRGESALNQRVCLLRDIASADMRFLAYALPDHLQTINDLTYATTVKHLSSGQVKAIRVDAPDVDEQRRIADYLDRETATIDTLIEKQRLLVTTLHERRRAAVDLEVEKLSRVHETVSYRRVVRSIRQGWSPQANNWPAAPGEWAVLKAGAVNHGRFNALQNKELPEELDPRPGTQVRPGDLVISRANTRELVGSAAVYLGEANSGLMLSDKLYALRHEVSVNPRFVALVLGSSRWRRLIELEATGASPSMQNISQDVILSLPMFVPPFDEQRRIADHLDEETAKIDALIAKAERFIELARERRAALITAAVTGQLSVD